MNLIEKPKCTCGSYLKRKGQDWICPKCEKEYIDDKQEQYPIYVTIPYYSWGWQPYNPAQPYKIWYDDRTYNTTDSPMPRIDVVIS